MVAAPPPARNATLKQPGSPMTHETVGPPSTGGRIRALIWRHPLLALAVPAFIGLAIQAALKKNVEWTDVYVAAARRLLDHGDIYLHGYLYPPFPALLAVPFTPLPDRLASLAFFLVNFACIVGLIRAAWELATGRSIDRSDSSDWRQIAVFALGLSYSGTFVLNALAHQQTDCIIAFLVMAGCLRCVRGGAVSGAILIGLAAAFKGPPLLFAAYFVFRRHWIAAALVVVTAVGVNLVPDLISRSPREPLWLLDWLRNTVLPSQQLNAPVGQWGTALIFNQSLGASLRRVLETLAPAAPLAPQTVKLMAYGILAAMLGATIAAAQYGRRLPSPQRADLPGRTAIEFAVVMLLMLLMSPMSGIAHFGPTVLAAFCLAQLALFGGSRMSAALLAIAIALALPANKDLVGATVYNVVLWNGFVTLSAVVLWIACLIALARREPAHEARDRQLQAR